jgi:hypothetical protein
MDAVKDLGRGDAWFHYTTKTARMSTVSCGVSRLEPPSTMARPDGGSVAWTGHRRFGCGVEAVATCGQQLEAVRNLIAHRGRMERL